MRENKILGISIKQENKQSILEKIKIYLKKPGDFFHIVSLNPENLVITQENNEFKKVIETAQIRLIDGVGIVLAGKLFGFKVERLTGVKLMKELIELADRISLTVLLIGGKPNLALQLAECYQKKHLKARIRGVEGIRNIKKPTKEEEKALFSIVADLKPNIILVAFGSPEQELWLARHNNELNGIVCMGVGQGFDVYGGSVKRAPVFIQKIGLEWFFRLLIQPRRWRRQLRLVKFLWLIVKERFI